MLLQNHYSRTDKSIRIFSQMVSISLYIRFARSHLRHGKYQFKYEETVIERFFNISCCAIFMKESYFTCFVTENILNIISKTDSSGNRHVNVINCCHSFISCAYKMETGHRSCLMKFSHLFMLLFDLLEV
jgi:hypothetical protein